MLAHVSQVESYCNQTNWAQQLIKQTSPLPPTKIEELARKLLEANQHKCASLLIDRLIHSGRQWPAIKISMFGHVQTKDEISCYNKYLSFKWGSLTSEIVKKAFELDTTLKSGKGGSLLRKVITKLDTDNYLTRKEKTITKLKESSEIFFTTLDAEYQPIGIEMDNLFQTLISFYKRITPDEILVLHDHKQFCKKNMETRDKEIIAQQEFLSAAYNSQIQVVSEERIKEIFGEEEGRKQIPKMKILGIKVFKVNDMEQRKKVAQDLINMKITCYMERRYPS